MYLGIYERFSFPIPLHGQNGRILRHSRAMSGSAGLSPSRNRKREDSTLSEYARNLRKECADLAAGQAVLTAENKSAKEIAGLRGAVLKVSSARTFPVTRLSRKLLISPFKSINRPGQVPGTSDASKTQLGLTGSWPEIDGSARGNAAFMSLFRWSPRIAQ
jgi:hypothetical protein